MSHSCTLFFYSTSLSCVDDSDEFHYDSGCDNSESCNEEEPEQETSRGLTGSQLLVLT